MRWGMQRVRGLLGEGGAPVTTMSWGRRGLVGEDQGGAYMSQRLHYTAINGEV